MFTPFDYQEDCLLVLGKTRQEGKRKALVVMATALGKTFTAAFDVKNWLAEHKGKKRILYLCHQNDILYQAKTTFEVVLGHARSYGYFHGQSKTMHSVDVLFASFQTMEGMKESFAQDEFAYVIVDESHHSQAESYRQTIEYFKPEFLLAITATPDRLDELDIRDIFGQEVYSLPLEEAMAHGYLVPVDYRLLADEILLSQKIETEKGKRSISELNKTIFIPRRDEEIARIISQQISTVLNLRTIIFCSSIRHCNRMADVIPDSFAIHSHVPEKERAVRIEMFRQGLINTVLVVDSFNEGIDIPAANVLVFLRSTDSRTIFFQQLGRGLRKAENKDFVLVLDFVANCERILMVDSLFQRVKDIWDRSREGVAHLGGGGLGDMPMTLNMSSVEFQETIIPILKLLHRSTYPTWQEASQASQTLGIKNQDEYRKKYKEDPSLPSAPEQAYSDFPGYVTYLGIYYGSVEEASAAALALGIRSSIDYPSKYKKDPRLNSAPDRYYKNFPGWASFLGKVTSYKTWQEASHAVKLLKIPNRREYPEMRKGDPKLPPRPQYFYEDFPGWRDFLETVFYQTWEEASVAIAGLGINSARGYSKKYKEDPKLPSTPHHVYKDFPGWKEFTAYGVKESLKQKTNS